MSLARIDLETSRFEIAADVGAKLLAPGTELPLSTCSYFAQVSEGRAFHVPFGDGTVIDPTQLVR